MIQFTPITDKQTVDALFPDLRENEVHLFAFIAKDNEEKIGKLCFSLTENACKVLGIQAQDALITEGLLRSALNFAANRGAYIATCSLQEYKQLLSSLHFLEKNGVFYGEIPSILTCSSCLHKAKGNV